MLRVNKENLMVAKNKVLKDVPLSKVLTKMGYRNIYSDSGKVTCPIHDDSSPSFFYDDNLQTFHCFGCQRKGTVIDLHRYMEEKEGNSITYIQALTDVATEYVIELPNIYAETELSRSTHKKVERFVVDPEFIENQTIKNFESNAKQQPIKTRLIVYGLLDKYYMGYNNREETIRKIKKVLGV